MIPPPRKAVAMDKLVELRELLAKALADDDDHMIAAGDDLAWLAAQLACWPTRVDDDCTTNDRFLRLSAAATLQSQASLIQGVRNVIERGGFRLVGGAQVADGMLVHGQKCDHGRFGFEDCIGCYDEALLAALDPESARKAHTEGGGEP